MCRKRGGQEHAKVHTGPSAVPTGALGTSPGHPGSTGRSIMHEAVCETEALEGRGWPEAGQTAQIFQWSQQAPEERRPGRDRDAVG